MKTQRKLNRKSLILLYSKSNHPNQHLVNEMVLEEAKPILSKYGKKFNVKLGKKRGRPYKLGMCYSNAARLMPKYKYVEGVIIEKVGGRKFAHAWNADNNGNHFDFTLPNPENYEYFGVEIHEKQVFEIGNRNGFIWFAALPFIETLKKY